METTDRIEQARAALKVISRTAAGGIDVPETYARIDALCDLALKGLQAEEMREAIRRIADQTPDEQTRRYALETLAGLAASPEREEGNMSEERRVGKHERRINHPAPRAAEEGEDAELARFLVAGDLSIMFHDGKGRSLSVEEKVTILNALCASSSPAIIEECAREGWMMVPVETIDRIARDCEHGSRIWKECDALLRDYRIARAKVREAGKS